MTYDNWKCTNPDDRWLGNPVDAAWQQFHDGEISLAAMGDALIDDGMHPYQVRMILSREQRWLIPKGYFGRED